MATRFGRVRTMEIRFDKLPDGIGEFKALCDLTVPENTCAMFLCALELFARDKAAGTEAFNVLRGPRPMLGTDVQFIKDRLRDKRYLPRIYFEGATPENDYEPSVPYIVDVQPGRATDEGYLNFMLSTAGADSPRPMTLRRKGNEWFLWEYSSIVLDVRKPRADDPWMD